VAPSLIRSAHRAGSFVHFVIPLPSEINASTSVAAIKAAAVGSRYGEILPAEVDSANENI
jgi:hypothetical protein